MDLIKSVSYDQTEIIKNILTLYSKEGYIDLDPTYSKGIFYKNTNIPEPKYKFDICPQTPDTAYGDSRDLPLDDSSINVEIFDPPFLATTGKSLNSENDNNIIGKRFGVYRSEPELHQFYIDSMKEAYRILNPNGILIFKCQDKVSSGKQYMTHCFVYNEAVRMGFYPKDLFILLSKSRIVANWQTESQKHSRKYHSYFWVLQKKNRNIKYIINTEEET